jgi:hypothetical protein
LAPTPSQTRGKSPAQRRAEAEAEALNQPQPNPDDTGSESADIPEPASLVTDSEAPVDAGSLIDQQVMASVTAIESSTPRTRKSKKDDPFANTTPPDVGEWQDFFARVVIRGATDWYLDQAFNGIEDLPNEREKDALELTDDERYRMAKPFAELANKLKITRRHGRTIIATTGSLESLLMLGKWVARVNRISRKYRQQNASSGRRQPQPPPLPPQTEPDRESPEHVNVRPSSPPQASANGSGYSLLNPGTG